MSVPGPSDWFDFVEKATKHPLRAGAALLLVFCALGLAAGFFRLASGGWDVTIVLDMGRGATPVPTPTGSENGPTAVASVVATPSVTPMPTPTPTATPMATRTPTPTPTPVVRPRLSVEEPADKSTVGGAFTVRGKSTELAGEKIYLVTQDLWPFPEQCETPVCPRYWMHDGVSVKVSGEFMGRAFACVDRAHYEVMLLYGVTVAGQTVLRDWLWDTGSRARPELPPKEDVIVLGSNLEVTADHTLGPPPEACSARGTGG